MFVRIPITSLSGGVSTQPNTKRLMSEVQEAENVVLSLERSLEKRPPLVRINGGSTNSSLDIPKSKITDSTLAQDNLYFHFVDVDGARRYCIVVNRSGFIPTTANNNDLSPPNKNELITVFRIEPTEWIKEEVDWANIDRGIFEYITNWMFKTQSQDHKTTPINEVFGSIDWGVGCILFNKTIPLKFLPDNSQYLSGDTAQLNNENRLEWGSPDTSTTRYIHSGDVFNYKISDEGNGCLTPCLDPSAPGSTVLAISLAIRNENVIGNSRFIQHVRDDIDFSVQDLTYNLIEVGQSRENFSFVDTPPDSTDILAFAGWNAQCSLRHLYHNPQVGGGEIQGTDVTKDCGYYPSPLPPVEIEAAEQALGFGKIWNTREPYLTFPDGFFRALRIKKQPYFYRVRSEGPNSVLDHRTFPIIIQKDTSTEQGKWTIKYMPLEPRKSGTSINNKGPKSVNNNEKITGMAFWKDRLWIGTDQNIFSSATGDYYNFWINNVYTITDSDPIDISSNVGSTNFITNLIPFQQFMFITTSGSTQFEVRGSSLEAGISPFNVEIRPTSFFSTASITNPQKMANSIFFFDASKVYAYYGGPSQNLDYSGSLDVSLHVNGYLPNDIGLATCNPSTNTIFFTDKNKSNILYLFTYRSNGQQVIQNAFYKWVFSSYDNIVGIKAYGKDMYILSRRSTGYGSSVVAYYISLEPVPKTTPLLDWLVKLDQPDSNIVYDPVSKITKFILPYYDPDANEVVLGPDWDYASPNGQIVFNQAYTRLLDVQNTTVGGSTVLVANGRWDRQNIALPTDPPNFVNRSVYAGRCYKMHVELSTISYRDANNNAISGVLNLRKITTRHKDTGQYNIEIERNGRERTVVESEPMSFNDITDPLGGFRIEQQGELVAKVMCNTDRSRIFLTSNYPTPVNITNIEVVGNFRLGNTSTQV